MFRLYSRPLSALAATPIPGTEGVRYQGPPFFSPDGQWLAFVVGNRLMKANLSGGQPEFRRAIAARRCQIGTPGLELGRRKLGRRRHPDSCPQKPGLSACLLRAASRSWLPRLEGARRYWTGIPRYCTVDARSCSRQCQRRVVAET